MTIKTILWCIEYFSIAPAKNYESYYALMSKLFLLDEGYFNLLVKPTKFRSFPYLIPSYPK